jgi:hypothetical protein
VKKKVLTLILHISSTPCDLMKRKRNEEEKEKKEFLSERETKKKYLGFTKFRDQDAPPFLRSLWPHCISRTFLLSERTRKSAQERSSRV